VTGVNLSASILAALVLSASAPAVMAQAPAWFYGHPAPTISGAAAFKVWHDCIAAAAVRLDDHKSSVMDIAVAIEPLCSAKEETMIDAINKEFSDKNPGIAANLSVKDMERLRQESRASFRQNIGTIILTLRKQPASKPSPATDQEQKHQRELLAAAKQCLDKAKNIASAAAAAHPELLDRLLKQMDDYTEKVIKDPRSCPPFSTD
jgi:hypothetical protein